MDRKRRKTAHMTRETDTMDYMMSNLSIDEAYEEFPVFFNQRYPHMALIRVDKGNYVMFPPNQQDWQFEIKSDYNQQHVWYVLGIKEDHADEMSLRYVKNGNTWEGKHWYP